VSQTVVYVFNMKNYENLELARQAATSLEAEFFSTLDRFCKITVVVPHSEIPNAFIENNQMVDFDCRTLNNSDSRYFNISAVVTGHSYQGLQAVELKQRHIEMFESYVKALKLRFVKEVSFPSRLIKDPESLVQENDVFSEELHSSNANFNYTNMA